MRNVLIVLLFPVFGSINTHAQSIAAIRFINKDSVYDFGAIPEGDAPTYQFQFKNTGTETLTITDIKSESTDLKFKWPGKPVKPGKKGMIVVTYSPKDQAVTGSFKNEIFIASNATEKPYPFIHVSGTVVPSKGGSSSGSATKQKSRGGRR